MIASVASVAFSTSVSNHRSRIGRAAAVTQRQVGRLVRIVDDLLDVSRVSRGRIELQRESVDVAVAVERALESSKPLLAARGHSVS